MHIIYVLAETAVAAVVILIVQVAVVMVMFVTHVVAVKLLVVIVLMLMDGDDGGSTHAIMGVTLMARVVVDAVMIVVAAHVVLDAFSGSDDGDSERGVRGGGACDGGGKRSGGGARDGARCRVPGQAEWLAWCRSVVSACGA